MCNKLKVTARRFLSSEALCLHHHKPDFRNGLLHTLRGGFEGQPDS